MRTYLLAAAALAAAFLGACNDTPAHPVAVPGPEDPAAYHPIPAPRPIPPSGYVPGDVPAAQPQPIAPQPSGAPAPSSGGSVTTEPRIEPSSPTTPR